MDFAFDTKKLKVERSDLNCEPDLENFVDHNGLDIEEFNIKIENEAVNCEDSENLNLDNLRNPSIKREVEDSEPDSWTSNNGRRKIQRLHSVSDEVDPLSLDDVKSSEASNDESSTTALLSDYSESHVLVCKMEQDSFKVEENEDHLECPILSSALPIRSLLRDHGLLRDLLVKIGLFLVSFFSQSLP